MKKRLFLFVTLLALCLSLSVSAVSYSDVPETHWAYDNITRANELGFMIGTGTTTFSPDAKITGSEGAIILARVYATVKNDKPALQALCDSASNWYQGYIDYCNSKGLLDAEATKIVTWYLHTPISRAQLLYLFSSLPDSVYKPINTVDDGMIPDLPANAYYRSAVYRAYRAGISIGINGYGHFAPDLSITRAEVAALAVRLADTNSRMKITLKFDMRTLINGMPLNPKSTGYKALDYLVDDIFAKNFKSWMTTYDKVVVCYDYLSDKSTYGASPVSGSYRPIYKQNPYTDPAPSLTTKKSSVMAGDRGYDYFYIALSDHALEGYTAMYATEMLRGMTGWCDHYSSAFVIMMQRLGLDCFPVYVDNIGYGPHMTAIMTLGGIDYIFDPQIEQVLNHKFGKHQYKYFCKSIPSMSSSFRYWDDLEECRALIGNFTYDANKMAKVNAQ